MQRNREITAYLETLDTFPQQIPTRVHVNFQGYRRTRLLIAGIVNTRPARLLLRRFSTGSAGRILETLTFTERTTEAEVKLMIEFCRLAEKMEQILTPEWVERIRKAEKEPEYDIG